MRTYYIRDHKKKLNICDNLNGVQSEQILKLLTRMYHDNNRFRRYVK